MKASWVEMVSDGFVESARWRGLKAERLVTSEGRGTGGTGGWRFRGCRKVWLVEDRVKIALNSQSSMSLASNDSI